MTSNLTSGNLKGQLPYLWIYYMLLCMRTTIQLDDQLLLEAKKHAAQTGRTLKAVIGGCAARSLGAYGGYSATDSRPL